MENIKLDNLYLGINDNKMSFLSLNFIPMTHNKHRDSSFFKNPITSEITEVKHGEKYPELDGYVNGFFTISVHQLNTLKKFIDWENFHMKINNMSEFLIQ